MNHKTNEAKGKEKKQREEKVKRKKGIMKDNEAKGEKNGKSH
jgi:hypothetical protein